MKISNTDIEQAKPVEESLPTRADDSCEKNRHLSIVSKLFDRHGKGFLDKTEQKARNLAESETGQVPPSTVINLLEKQLGLAKKVKVLAILNIFTLMAIIGLAIALGVGNKNTQDAINDSIHMQTLSDPDRGLKAVLTDLDGNPVSTVSKGFSATATAFEVNDTVSGTMTACISAMDLAQMLLNNENGIKNTVSIKDGEGYVVSLLNMEGDVVIMNDYITMASGKFKFSFDSPECNGAVDMNGEDDGTNHRHLMHEYVEVLTLENYYDRLRYVELKHGRIALSISLLDWNKD